MTASMTGADVDELQLASAQLRTAADELDRHARSLTSILMSLSWIGGAASRFHWRWSARHRPQMLSTAAFIRDAAAQLERNADEQRVVSAPSVSSFRTVSAIGPIGIVSTDVALVDHLASRLDVFGVGVKTAKSIAGMAGLMSDVGVVDELIGFLTDERFVSVIEGLGTVVDVGEFVLDFFQDFVDYPGLATDERLVHALADSSLRLGVTEGVDKGMTLLTTALLSSVLPGLGTGVGVVAGRVLGPLLGDLADNVIDAADLAFDVMDLGADRVVDAYRLIKDALGLAGAAIDFGLDLGSEMIDLGGTIGEGIWDGIGGAVGKAKGWLF
jgi:hypothetical protein